MRYSNGWATSRFWNRELRRTGGGNRFGSPHPQRLLMSSTPAERRIVHFTGHVQGVGFRYTARQVAGAFKVTGYVRNLPDGSVETVVEGESSEIDHFLTQLGATMKRHIRQMSQSQEPATGEFGGFEIRH
jgi:acylphosphatase